MHYRRKRFLIGLGFGFAGAATLGGAALYSPAPAFVIWAVFAAAYTLLSLYAVEVNDRYLMSSSVMPLLTGGVVFAAQTGSAVFGLCLMALLGAPSVRDFRERRLIQPLANAGQLVVSAALAGISVDAVLRFFGPPSGVPPVAVLVAAGGLAAIVHTAVNNPLVALGIRLIYGTRAVLPWEGMRGLIVSEGIMGMLGGLLGGVLLHTSVSVLPLILVVYVAGHMAFVSHARVRQAHESTLRAFVKSLETRDLYTRGHTERVAHFTRLMAEQLRLPADRQAKLRVAALIHDMGKLAVPTRLIRTNAELDDEEYRQLRRATHAVDDLLSEVDFLRPLVDMTSGCHSRLTGEDFGQVGHVHTDAPTLDQQIIAVADSFDAMTSVRGYRMALSQEEVLALLRADGHPLYGWETIDALERGLAAVGERYGPHRLAGTLEARRG